METIRNYAYDYIKGIAIILVVMGHLTEAVAKESVLKNVRDCNINCCRY